ncbi:NAD(P)/FAD-dependent oxidoreductase [Aquimarina longa]|uniref:NAD(P)/FAD-dependent oxidoreductase n=1 Tax=Aquimarina longa TaxID=1080221 RepID=UPI0007807677|nr:FAD-dependent oxidoreductase [Aquimarina longa]
MLDYIIVGFGLSGLSFVEQLEDNNKSYIVYEDFSQKSSRVAGGLYNPVILKRFTLAWQAFEQLKVAIPFYQNIQKKLQQPLISDLPVMRRFNSVEEQNSWFEACDKPILGQLLSPELIHNTTEGLDIPFHYGEVKCTGKIDIYTMLSSYIEYLKKKDAVINESFEYSKMLVKDKFVEYKGIKSKRVLFAEGYGMINNPFFNHLPIYGNKGEYIIIKCEALKLQKAIKSSVFIIPLGDDLYKVGATYANDDKTPEVTTAAREELQRKLNQFLTIPYKVVDQVAGIRPTVRDRRPLIGTHTDYQNIHVLNGLGSRGILIGPTIAKRLYNHIEKGASLNQEVDIKRFDANL